MRQHFALDDRFGDPLNTRKLNLVWILIALALTGCADDANTTSGANNSTNAETNNSMTAGTNNATTAETNNTTTGTNNATTATNNTTTNNATTGTNNSTTATNNQTTVTQPCDFRAVDGIIAFEAESLPLNEDWKVRTQSNGFDGSGYMVWEGNAFNNIPTHGVIKIDIKIDEPGRYQFQWRSKIGMGSNTTEHNDAWVRFPGAADFYGLKGQPGAEIRRYPKPICDDAAAMAAVTASADVDTADCVRGSSKDGWIKVYSSGANDWKWSTFTSDNDASRVMAEFDSPGVYTFELAARADFFLIDRMVIHKEGISDAVAQAASETACGL